MAAEAPALRADLEALEEENAQFRVQLIEARAAIRQLLATLALVQQLARLCHLTTAHGDAFFAAYGDEP